MKLYQVKFTNQQPMLVRAEHLTAAVEVARLAVSKRPSRGPWDITKVVYCGQESQIIDATKLAIDELAEQRVEWVMAAVTSEPKQPSAKELRKAARAADPVVQAKAAVHKAIYEMTAAIESRSTVRQTVQREEAG